MSSLDSRFAHAGDRRSGRCCGWLLVVGLLAGVLIGCARPPIDISGTTLSNSPADIASGSGPAAGRVLWGGLIVASENLDALTQLEVLAYPLDRIQRPRVDVEAQGRFLILVDGYLETLDFSAGREVTVLGDLIGTVSGNIGEATYRYPQVAAGELHLWRSGRSAPPRFSFGLGVSLSN